jgi:hypothetical protein
MTQTVHPTRLPGPRRAAGRRRASGHGRAPRPARVRPPRGFFFARSTQQMTSARPTPLRLEDLLSAGAALGALALWGAAIHLLAP